MSDDRWITDAASLIAAGWRVQWSHPDVSEGRCVDTEAALHIQKLRTPPKRTTLARLPAIAPPIPSDGEPTKPARRDPRRDDD